MMPEAPTDTQILLARLAALLLAAFTVVSLLWYGISPEVYERVWRDIAERPGGPMTFRFVLQPCMAAIAAVHDGISDARAGRSPYFWTLLTSPAKRGGRLREGLIATARIILLGLTMDTIYQLTVLKAFYPGEAVIITLLLAVVPYVLLRGPATRIWRWWSTRSLLSKTE